MLVPFAGALYVLTAREAGDNSGVAVDEAPLVILALFIFWRVRRRFRRGAQVSPGLTHTHPVRSDEQRPGRRAGPASLLTTPAPARGAASLRTRPDTGRQPGTIDPQPPDVRSPKADPRADRRVRRAGRIFITVSARNGMHRRATDD